MQKYSLLYTSCDFNVHVKLDIYALWKCEGHTVALYHCSHLTIQATSCTLRMDSSLDHTVDIHLNGLLSLKSSAVWASNLTLQHWKPQVLSPGDSFVTMCRVPTHADVLTDIIHDIIHTAWAQNTSFIERIQKRKPAADLSLCGLKWLCSLRMTGNNITSLPVTFTCHMMYDM